MSASDGTLLLVTVTPLLSITCTDGGSLAAEPPSSHGPREARSPQGPRPHGHSLLALQCEPYVVHLRTAWRTSHSTTTTRTNALVSVAAGQWAQEHQPTGAPAAVVDAQTVTEDAAGGWGAVGFGEVGLPPKNPMAGYHADYADVCAYVTEGLAQNMLLVDAAAMTRAVGAAMGGGDSTPAPVDLVACACLLAIAFVECPLSSTRRRLRLPAAGVADDAASTTDAAITEGVGGAPSSSSGCGGSSPAKADCFGRSGVQCALLDLLGQALRCPVRGLLQAWEAVAGIKALEQAVQALLLPPREEAIIAGSSNACASATPSCVDAYPHAPSPRVIPDALLALAASLVPEVAAAARRAVEVEDVVQKEAGTRTEAASGHSSPSAHPPCFEGYMTVGMDNPPAMAAAVVAAVRHTTPFIKIKLDGDMLLSKRRLTAIAEAIADTNSTNDKTTGNSNNKDAGATSVTIVVDANAAWTPEGLVDFAEWVAGQRATAQAQEPSTSSASSSVAAVIGAVQLVEQPFPADLHTLDHTTGEHTHCAVVREAWVAARAAAARCGLLLFADESACSAADLLPLQPFVSGVNIKLEKCGGPIAAFRFARAALAKCEGDAGGTEESLSPAGGTEAAAAACADLHPLHRHQGSSPMSFVWIGIMVGTRLLCGHAAQLLPFAGRGDCDGALLVTEACQRFEGGFEWCTHYSEEKESTGRGATLTTTIGSGRRHGYIYLPGPTVGGVGLTLKKEGAA